uniref:CSON000084 protein n=1 Tax=Culicoides sonorensis TaxID=179676 RepID=A0A336LQ28_CULSO
MKATLWMCSVLTTILFLTNNVSAIPSHYPDSRYLEDNLLMPKRSKPSLSIVNPLDTLRQRIMLEMSRRQMREKEKQIEDNKALFRQIGKRGDASYYFDPLFTGTDLVSSFDNRHQIDTNTGQLLNDMSAKNVNGRLPIYQQIASTKNHAPRNQNNNNNNNNNLNNEESELLSQNGVENNDLDMNMPNDDYRLRYVYSMQQNRYN